MRMDNFAYLGLILLGLSFGSCKTVQDKPLNKPNHYRIMIIPPASCISEISIGQDGQCILRSGNSLQEAIGKIKKLDIIKSTAYFLISNEDVEKISRHSNAIGHLNEFRTVPMSDAFQFKVFINDSCLLDSYRMPIQLDSLITSLVYLVPVNKDICHNLDYLKANRISRNFK